MMMYCSLKLSFPIIHTRMSNLIFSLREKISTNNHIETKFMDYFFKSQTFSAQWVFTYAGNKLCLHKKENYY